MVEPGAGTSARSGDADDRRDTWIEARASRLSDAPERVRDRYLRAVCRLDPALADALAERIGDEAIPRAPVVAPFGPFRPLRRLGGGLVEVWLAVDERTDRPVVLKRTHPAAGPAEPVRSSIRREVVAGTELHLPGIPRVLESGEIDGAAYVVREFVPGATLSEWIAARRAERMLGLEPNPDEVRELLACFSRAARVVAALHETGWVHGDLKPGNLLVGLDGEPWLLDLGCAARIGEPLSTSGSPAYAAPERLREAMPRAEPAIDVWALGAALFECVALELPFRADDPDSLLLSILQAPLPPISRDRPWLPVGLDDVIRWALDRRQERRCPTAGAFADDLECACAGLPTRAARILRDDRRRGLSRLLALFLVASIAIAATAFVTREARADPDLPRLLATHGWIDVATREAAAIGPAWPENLARLRDWLDRHAVPLRARRAVIAERVGNQEELQPELDALDVFLAPESGTVADVERRLRIASTIAIETIDAAAPAWSEAAQRISANPSFAGFTLTPLVGLVPLGPDPKSGLEEFHDVGSAAPGTPTPRRDDRRGRLEMDARHGLVLVLLPGARFLMGEQGSDPSGPAYDPHAGKYSTPEMVEVAPFLISKFEITNGQWARLSGSELPSYLRPGRKYANDPPIGYRHPVEQVSWEDAHDVLLRAGLDLPTEAQWERAAQATAGACWTFGDDLEELPLYGNVIDAAYVAAFGPTVDALEVSDGFARTAPVGSFLPNQFGLFDLHGNVAEWCRDIWDAFGPDNPPRAADGLRSPAGRHRAIRGGSYSHSALDARTRFRVDDLPTLRSVMIGVRPVRALPGVGR